MKEEMTITLEGFPVWRFTINPFKEARRTTLKFLKTCLPTSAGHTASELGEQDKPGWRLSIGTGLIPRDFIPEKRSLAREGIVYMNELDQFGIVLYDDLNSVVDGVVGKIDVLNDNGFHFLKKKLRSDKSLVFLRAYFVVTE